MEPHKTFRVAFDLDNTLIRCGYDFEIEEPTKKILSKFFKYEKLRRGTISLCNSLSEQNIEIWVYTTSLRKPAYIKRMFWLYGIKLDGVVNQTIHTKHVTVNSSKYPVLFGIELLIDDSEGVRLEAEKFGFNALIVQPEDINWVNKISEAVMMQKSLQS